MSYGALDVHQGESPETPQYSCYFHTSGVQHVGNVHLPELKVRSPCYRRRSRSRTRDMLIRTESSRSGSRFGQISTPTVKTMSDTKVPPQPGPN